MPGGDLIANSFAGHRVISLRVLLFRVAAVLLLDGGNILKNVLTQHPSLIHSIECKYGQENKITRNSILYCVFLFATHIYIRS